MKIILGLGNPGQQYKNNRHNIGWMVLEALADSQKVKFKRSWRLRGAIAEESRKDLLLVKSRTFMNNSGICARRVCRHYKVSNSDFLVVYDDVDLDLGVLRLREKGSSGGHRGMSSLIDSLASENINRLRVGIGKDLSVDTADYVLTDFSPREKQVLPEVINKSVAICQDWIEKGVVSGKKI